MRAKTALWAAPLALFVAGGWSGNCFSQSDFGPEPSDVRVVAAAANPNQLILAAVSPKSLDQLDSQTDAADGNTGGNAARGEADPPAKRPGQISSSKVGIGVK